MRIVNRKEFLKLPMRTVYSLYDSGRAEGLFYKDETLENDWFYQDLIFSKPTNISNSEEYLEHYEKAENNRDFNFELDLDCSERDGEFEENQMFLVYDKSDVKKLINALINCL